MTRLNLAFQTFPITDIAAWAGVFCLESKAKMAAPSEVKVSKKGDEFMQFSPSEWRKYVYKEVLIESIDKKIHKGWVHTIDPVSKR